MDKYSRNGKILITVLGGWFGLHHYLNKNYKMGVLYTFTFGCFYIGWIIDIVKVLKDNKWRCTNERRNTYKKWSK